MAAVLSLAPMVKAQTEKEPLRPSENLSEATNLKAFEKQYPLSAEQKAKIRDNLFVVSPTDSVQLFHIYENNGYREVPSFITSDTMLQLYHVFYGFTLRQVEAGKLLPILKRLTRGNLNSAIIAHQALSKSKTPNKELIEAARKNVAYFGVADRLLGLRDALPDAVMKEVRAELKLAQEHEGFSQGAIFPYKIDYSQFVSRGHYTRSLPLKQYFGGMMWYGLVPLAVRYEDNGAKIAREQVLQSLLLVRGLYGAGLDKDWDRVYEPTAFYVGAADDLTPSEWKNVADRVFGADPSVTSYTNTAKMNAFVEQIEKARASKIQAKFGRANGVPAGTPNMIEPPVPLQPQLRFMGQRYIPDSEILQRLSEPIARPFPNGLDVMVVLGNERAKQLLDTEPLKTQWPEYSGEREKLINQFKATPASTWTSNLYWSWLHVLQSVPFVPQNAPGFMKNTAWQDKSLNTALASWAELRHDTILYAKQSTVEMGGEPPELLRGYVEPNVVLYDRLLNLTRQSREGLTKRDLMNDKLKTRFENFENLLGFLKTASEKELRGEKLSEEGYRRIQEIGGELESLTMSVMDGDGNGWEILSEADKNMAVVADVHTAASQALEVGVGRAAEIVVMVPVEGKWTLARGAIFQYHEFQQQASDRLTDEKWQKMLAEDKAPAPPEWTNGYRVDGAVRSESEDETNDE